MKAPLADACVRPTVHESCQNGCQYDRWRVCGAYVDVEDERFTLNGISISGFQLYDDERRLRANDMVEGTINWPTGGRSRQFEFKAKAVWADYHEQLCGVAFGPMEGRQIDKLLGVLKLIEDELRTKRDRQDRAAARRSWIRLAITLLSMVGAVFVVGYGVWVFTIGKASSSVFSNQQRLSNRLLIYVTRRLSGHRCDCRTARGFIDICPARTVLGAATYGAVRILGVNLGVSECGLISPCGTRF